MDKIGFIYEKPTLIKIGDKKMLMCRKGMKLKIIKDCFDEHYLHELTNHYREGLEEKSLNTGDVVEVIGCWKNLYGSYINCTFNNEKFDISPKNLSFK